MNPYSYYFSYNIRHYIRYYFLDYKYYDKNLLGTGWKPIDEVRVRNIIVDINTYKIHTTVEYVP